MRNMRNVLKKKAAVIMAVVILVTAMVVIPTMTAQAASPQIAKSYQFRLYKGYTAMPMVQVHNASGGKITKLRSSKPSVAKASVSSFGKDKNYFVVELKSPGSTRISFYCKGKKLTTKITVKKWENPCKEFKIGNKDYAKVFDKSERFNLNNQKKTINAKVKITPKKGWKLLKIVTQTADELGNKKVKNNSKTKFSIKLTGTAIYAHFKNIKTGERETVALCRSSSTIENKNEYFLWIDNARRTRSVWDF